MYTYEKQKHKEVGWNLRGKELVFSLPIPLLHAWDSFRLNFIQILKALVNQVDFL